MSSESNFAYSLKYNTHFIVRNTCTDRKKTISVFNYPINFGETRDLLQIPGVEESNIRASLLKGVLRHKLLNGDITLVSSNIDLLQFSDKQRAWLYSHGFTEGVAIGYDELDGYVQSIIGTGGGGGSGITANEHATLRQLIHFIDEGPGDGFLSGAYKIVTGQPFPTSIVWYLSLSMTQKLVEKLITYNPNKTPAVITWHMYATDGVTIVHTVTDTITYVSGAFEASRTRAIS
jgi:hypothetical protein